MRLLFSFLFSAACCTASAQLLGPDTDKQISESIRQRVEEGTPGKRAFTLPKFKTELPSVQESSTGTMKAGVRVLPQDNMPCVVPDTQGIAAIPNAAPKVYPYRKDMPTKPFQKEGVK